MLNRSQVVALSLSLFSLTLSSHFIQFLSLAIEIINVGDSNNVYEYFKTSKLLQLHPICAIAIGYVRTLNTNYSIFCFDTLLLFLLNVKEIWGVFHAHNEINKYIYILKIFSPSQWFQFKKKKKRRRTTTTTIKIWIILLT